MTTTMKVLSILALLLPVGAIAQTRVHAGLSFGDRGNGFFVELSDHYGVPYDDVCYVRDAGIPEAEVSDILYIYRHSHYPLRHIVDLRLRGATWLQLYTWCGIPQDVYYQSGAEIYRHGPPYGNAYGYYKHHRDRGYVIYDRERVRDRDDWGDRDDSGNRGHGHGRHKGWDRQ